MSQTEHFNEPQQRRLLASASYIDKLLLEIEQILSASSSGGFPKYKNPLAPVQVRVVRDYIKRLRQQMVRVLADLEVALPEPRFDTTFSIKVTLQFIEVALEEIAPERLIGYGSVAESLKEPLAGGVQEMTGIVRQMSSYLSQGVEADLSNRLLQLRGADDSGNLLEKLGEILERHRLVEFRASLSQLLEKIEAPSYEIAFFGRVSTGKSSLLNAIMGIDLLPVGVTPITAVPTRIKNGPASHLFVWTAEARFAEYGLERLPEFVTEAKNPGNEKRIARLLVEVPLPMLPEEVLLVDTPGLGSLALEGATETLAYLPRCDLGVVLVDATSNLQADDVGTVDALRAASVPALVVLSKVDLIPEQERQRLLDYTRTQLAHQLGMEIDVALLSSRPELKDLLQDWVANQIAPRVADAKRLSRESNQRKTRSLSRRILHALEIAAKAQGVRPDGLSGELKSAEAQLRHAASLIASGRNQSFELIDEIRDAGEQTLNRVTENALAFWQEDPGSTYLDDAWITRNINRFVQAEAERLANFIQNVAGELTGALETAASVLSTGEGEDRFTLQNLVKDMPSDEFASAPFRLRKPPLLSVSAGWARRSVRHQLERQLGVSLSEFFTSYARTLEVWIRSTLDSIAREFEVHADIYRAQLQRLTGSETAQEGISPERVLQDVSFLREELELEEPVESSATT
jgi:GTP-binding protein EngB required for normal cell division